MVSDPFWKQIILKKKKISCYFTIYQSLLEMCTPLALRKLLIFQNGNFTDGKKQVFIIQRCVLEYSRLKKTCKIKFFSLLLRYKREVPILRF